MLRGQPHALILGLLLIAAIGHAAENCDLSLNQSRLFRSAQEIESELLALGFRPNPSEPGVYDNTNPLGIQKVRVHSSPKGHAYSESVANANEEWTVERVRDELVVPEVLRDWNVLEVALSGTFSPGDIELRLSSADIPLVREPLLQTVGGFAIFKRVVSLQQLEKVGLSRWQFLTVSTFRRGVRKMWAVERFSGYFHELFFDSSVQTWRLVPADYKLPRPEPLSRFRRPAIL